jgi:hypothetical protein
VTSAEAEKIKAALEAVGCTGGKMEKETEGSGYFEVDDAKCRDGQYDIKLDKDFKVIVVTGRPSRQLPRLGCAKSGCGAIAARQPLFDHLVGAGEQVRPRGL